MMISLINQQLTIYRWELMEHVGMILSRDEIELLKLMKYKNELLEEMKNADGDNLLFYKKSIDVVRVNIDMLTNKIQKSQTKHKQIKPRNEMIY